MTDTDLRRTIPSGPRRTLIPSDPVLVGRKLTPGAKSPLVGDDEVRAWDLNALGRPANRNASWGRVTFGALDGEWLITAKQLAVISLSPSHPLFVDCGARIRHRPQSPLTANELVAGLRLLRQYVSELRLPMDLNKWTVRHFDRAYRHVGSNGTDHEHDRVFAAIGRIHEHRHLFEMVSYKGTPAAISAVLRRTAKSSTLSTQPVEPAIWRATLHAAMAYVTCFSVDILAARKEEQRLTAFTQRVTPKPEVVDRFLARPGSLIPVRRTPLNTDDSLTEVINWRLLSLRVSDGTSDQVFTGSKPLMRQRRSHVIAKVRLGEWTIAGLHQPAQHIDGRDEPWTESLDGIRLARETVILRAAGYIVIAALTMMRDSEVQELRHGSLTTDHGVPAITGVRVKGRLYNASQTWWINSTVAEAITVLEQLNPQGEHLFSSIRENDTENVGFEARGAILDFIRHINRTLPRTGLPEIPGEHVTPQMLRRTMSMLAAQEPYGEIAAGMQLGHCFRRAMAGALTAGYTVENKRWEAEFLSKEAERAAQELAADITAEGVQEIRGPGAHRVVHIADPVIADEGMRRRLLSQFPDLQIGTFNLCLGDRNVARCIDPAAEGRQSLLLEQCEPDRCTNSVVLVKQQAAWLQDVATINQFLGQRGLAPHLREQLTEKKRALERALQTHEGRSNDQDKPKRVGPSGGEHRRRDETPP